MHGPDYSISGPKSSGAENEVDLSDVTRKEERGQYRLASRNMTGEQGETSAWFSRRITAYLLITSVS